MDKLSKSKSMKMQAVKRTLRKFFLGAFIIFSFMLIFIGNPDSATMQKTQGVVLNAVAPVADAMGYPFRKLAEFVEYTKHFMRIDEENRRLLLRIEEMNEQIAILNAENAELEKVRLAANYVSDVPASVVAIAKVVGRSGGGFSHSYILNAGRRSGVEKYQGVVAEGNLVGQIVGAGDEYSRMILITDANSRIPVMMASSGVRAFLSGNNSTHPKVVHFESPVAPEIGEVVMTSGMDGNLPAGIPIGVIGAVSEEDGVVLQPFSKPATVYMVKIIKSNEAIKIAEFKREEEGK
ncbi:MAG: rod shape-determining protein MreC [Alphaproteobacteria bacterium]|nr:rod shape-determining protein MreC [Alphaproteobacteria bacterium]